MPKWPVAVKLNLLGMRLSAMIEIKKLTRKLADC